MLSSTLRYIQEKLLAQPNFANVYLSLPYVKDKFELHRQFESPLSPPEASVQAWEITNLAGEEDRSDSGNCLAWHDTLQIQGFLGFSADKPTNDLLAAQFQQQLDTIKQMFHNDETLGNTMNSRSALRLISNQPTWFYDRLCFHAVFHLNVTWYSEA